MLSLILATVVNTHATVQLLAPEAFQRDVTSEVAIDFRIQRDWHIYWENPGDSGEEPRAKWIAPDVSIGAIEFPIPSRLPAEPFTNFGFSSEFSGPGFSEQKGRPVVFRVPVRTQTKKDHVDLALSLTYLVCKEACVPEKAELKIRVPVTDHAVPGLVFNGRDFPKRLGRGSRTEPHRASSTRVGDALRFELPVDWQAATAFEFFPLTVQALTAKDPGLKNQSGTQFDVAVDSAVTEVPKNITGLLVDRKNARAEWIEYSAASETSWLAILKSVGFALLGGFLLNLMPCVFPVVSLKILSFVRESAGHPREIRRHAYAYIAGVVLSLWVLVAVLLVIRALGGAVGWGFQLQNPMFLFSLLGVFFFLGLNLVGVFEINYQGPARLQNLMSMRGYAGSFFTGLLTTLVATPCSAPFMGVAIGTALAGTVLEAFTVFTALALGLSAPYFILALRPAWVARLPKPGAWMETLRGVLAFPLFLTAVWMFWVLSQTVEIGALVLILVWCTVASFFAWSLRLASASRGNRILRAIAVLFLIAMTAVTFSMLQTETSVPTASDGDSKSENISAVWQPYSDARLKLALAGGKSVFVDFTASWCVTCQVNKRLVLMTASGDELFATHGVVRLRADWTKRDPEITNALSRLGRNSVPVYAYYRKGSSEARLLPEILTIDILKNALEAE